MSLAITEKYDLVRTLIILGKKRGYLLYDEVNDILPAEVHSLEEIEDLLSTFEQYGIDIYEDVSAAKAARAEFEVAEPVEAEAKEEVAGGNEEVELDLTPGLLEKTTDPVRLYLREMGSVPLLEARRRGGHRQAPRARAATGAQEYLSLADCAQGVAGHWRRASQGYPVDQGNCPLQRGRAY